MGFLNLAFCLTASTVLLAPAAWASPRFQIQPVNLLGYEGKALRLSVEMPCGGIFYGLIAQTSDKGVLSLAAAIRQENVACMAIPEPFELLVDYLDTTGFKEIAPLRVTEASNHMRIARITDLRVGRDSRTAGAGGGDEGVPGQRLDAVYETKCGAHLGVLIRRSGVHSLQLGVAERPLAGTLPSDCRPRPQTLRVTALDMQAKYRVSALRERTVSLKRAYYLRLAEVRPGSVARQTGGGDGLTLEYKRSCNEAPIGLVLGAPGRFDRHNSLKVGMLVAHYYNLPCAEPRALNGVSGPSAAIWSIASEPDLAVPASARVALLPTTTDMDALRLRAPLALARIQQARAEGLSISFIQGCHAPLGTVYARDLQGKLAIGLVTVGGVEPCTARPAETSLFQPYLARRVTTKDLFPLKLPLAS